MRNIRRRPWILCLATDSNCVQAFEADTVIWTIHAKGTLTVHSSYRYEELKAENPGTAGYCLADCWGECGRFFIHRVILEEGCSCIAADAFLNMPQLETVVLPGSLRRIGADAFSGASGIRKILFQGTQMQWKAIEKAVSWDENTGAYSVICTDGTLTNEQFETIIFRNRQHTEHSLKGEQRNG